MAAAGAGGADTPARSDVDSGVSTPANGHPHGLADAAEARDRMGAETNGDEGRGEEAGEGLSTAGGAALGEM